MAVDKEVEEEEGGERIEGGRRRRYPQKPKVAHVEGTYFRSLCELSWCSLPLTSTTSVVCDLSATKFS